MIVESKNCIGCGRQLIQRRGVDVCLHCNSELLSAAEIFIEAGDGEEYVIVECFGATLYKQGTNDVAAGLKFTDDDDPSKGHKIIDHPVYASTHKKKRRIKREALGRLRRCQACQDLTVRMRRPEGPDLFVPSAKHPGRTKLKPAKYRTYA